MAETLITSWEKLERDEEGYFGEMTGGEEHTP
jgi:hypothetical protein